MIKLFKEENIIYKIITLAVLGVIVWFLINVAQKMIVSINYPGEILEPANVALSNLFLQGKSPYSLSALDWEVPGINYDYPFLTSLVVAGISKITGIGTAACHYYLSYLCIILTGLVGYLILRQYAKTTISPVLGGFLFMLCHWRFGFVSAAPDDFGEFLFILTLCVAIMPRIKNKPLLCAIGVTLCFYTKQYFVFAALGIFIYFLFYSRKTAFKFFIYTLMINFGVAVLISIFWPLYWTYSFLFLYIGCFTGKDFGFSFLLGQMKYLAAIFIGLFAILIIAFIKILKKLKASNSKLSKLRPKENDALSLFIIQIPVMFLPLIFFGRNDGAFLSYFLQLWMPSIIVVSLIALEGMKPAKKEWIFGMVYAAVTLFTIYFGIGKLPMHKLSSDEIANWEKAYKIVDEYSSQGDIFYSRALSYKAFENGNGDCLCGHDGEINEESYESWKNSAFLQKIFPYAGEIIQKNLEYRYQIQTNAALHNYRLVTFERRGYSLLFSRVILEGWSLTYIDEFKLQLGNVPYTVVFFEASPLENP